MPGEDVYSWSKTAASNSNADTSINWAEGQARATVNDSARSMMAALAKQFALFTGSIVTAGTINAQTFTSGVGYTTVPINFYARLKVGVGLTNTGAMTLRMDGLTAYNVLTATGVAMGGGEFSANGYVEVVFNGTNWVLLGSTSAAGGGGGGGGGAPSSYTLATTPGNFFYNRSGTVTNILVECVGGGGAGGGCSAYPFAPTSTGAQSAGGGGSGGYSRKLLTPADFAIKEPIMVAFGGLGGFGQPGLSGGTTQFGSPVKCQALGGWGGRGEGSEGGQGGPVTGAQVAIGDLVLTGTPGEAGYGSTVYDSNQQSNSGHGGSSFFGGGAPKEQNPPSYSQVNGLAGRYGGGGSGATTASNGSAIPGATGGNGGHGLILITEWGGHGTITVS